MPGAEYTSADDVGTQVRKNKTGAQHAKDNTSSANSFKVIGTYSHFDCQWHDAEHLYRRQRL